ncbi:MAG: glycosyltransferase [Saprospiraceae bacterium]|nr:glycosyltransferase [Saprospiraceae bacterium]
MDNPKISVILPFHGEAPFADLAVHSIIDQTYHDWELILVSNNARHVPLQRLKKIMQNDSRIKLLHEPKQGIAHALNTGILEARGTYIARMDADDIAMPERLERQIVYLQNHRNTDVVSCRCTIPQTEHLPNEGYRYFVAWQNRLISHEDHFNARFVESPLAHPSVMFRKKLIDEFGYYSTENIPEDYELWLRWMHQGVRFYKIPEYLLQWNDLPERLSRTHPNYSKAAFWKVKSLYLAKWFLQSGIANQRKTIICGSSVSIRKKAKDLITHGMDIYGCTDVKKRNLTDFRFIDYRDITDPEMYCLINLIEKREAGNAIVEYYSKSGFVNGKDIILAG